MDKLKFYIVLLLILFSNSFYSQSASTYQTISLQTNETLFVHLNATSFVTGETLLYKLYCLNPADFSKSKISKVAYVELIGNEKQVLFSHKLFLENCNQGDFFIPANIPTGSYKIVAYTRWMLNNTITKNFESTITIINPFQNQFENKIGFEQSNSINNATDSQKATVSIQINDATTRSLVDFTIKSDDLELSNGNYSISVIKTDAIQFNKRVAAEDFINTTKKTNSELEKNTEKIILPELRGEIISGTIASKSNEISIKNIPIGLSIPGKNFEFKITKTNEDGKFLFSIDKPYYDSNLIVQVLSPIRTSYSLTLDKPLRIEPSINLENKYPLQAVLKKNIEERSIASQIENSYFMKKADSISKKETNLLFYQPLEKDYILDNYTRFPTFKETITEVIKEMHYDKNGEIYELRLSDYDPLTELTEPPLVLVDGLLIQNINELLEYKTVNIYKIAIIPGGYKYGNKNFNGLISIITKRQEYTSADLGEYCIKTTIPIPVAKKIYFKQDYTNKELYARIPDYRRQLLWITDVTITNNTYQNNFYTSDIKGTYELVIEGFTASGKAVSASKTFEVN